MSKIVDLFCGCGSLQISFKQTYLHSLVEEIVDSIIDECFNEILASELNTKFKPDSTEYQEARHLADLDILDLFIWRYVRSHRNYKYSKGRSDTAFNVITVLNEHGIYVTESTYNNWRRKSGKYLIPDRELDLILELLDLSPNDFKRLIFAHIAARREIKKELSESGIGNFFIFTLTIKGNIVLESQFPRPPCVNAA